MNYPKTPDLKNRLRHIFPTGSFPILPLKLKLSLSLSLSLSLLLLLSLLLGSCTVSDGIEDLPAGKGRLLISITNSDLQARVFLNGLPTDFYSSDDIELPAGEHILKILRPGYVSDPDSFHFRLFEEEIFHAAFELKAAASGDLEILNAPPGLQLEIDGLLRTDPDGEHIHRDLPAGSRRLRLSCPGYSPRTLTAEIPANSRLSLDAALSPLSDPLLIEHFSNVSCNPCAERDEVLISLIDSTETADLFHIAYHTDFPSESDPFFLEARELSEERTDYYGVRATPAFFMHGSPLPAYTNTHIELGLTNYLTNTHADTESALLSLQIHAVHPALRASVKLHSLPDHASPLSLRAALIDRMVIYSAPPGTNGVTHFENVVRDLITLSTAIVSTSAVDQSFELTFDPELIRGNHGWQIVVFLQDDSDRRILGSSYSPILRQTDYRF